MACLAIASSVKGKKKGGESPLLLSSVLFYEYAAIFMDFNVRCQRYRYLFLGDMKYHLNIFSLSATLFIGPPLFLDITLLY